MPENDDTGHDERVRAPLERPARALAEPFRDFISAQGASGWVLLAATALAIVAANTPWASLYFRFLHAELAVTLAGAELGMSLRHWVNDGLMALFFFLLGLELKRELLVGRLSELRRAASVVCAAAGGMVLPAAVFLIVARDPAVQDGWAIPVATDTAFALMILVLLGDRVPAGARAFLVGLAIVDDLGAILVIALAYTQSFDASLAIPTALVLGVLTALNLIGVRRGLPYACAGVALWLLFIRLGLHGTLAGVVVALAAPVRPEIPRRAFAAQLKRRARRFEATQDDATETILEQPDQQAIAHEVLRAAERATPPLSRWERHLEGPVSYLVVPLFAFMNAGIGLSHGAIAGAWESELSVAVLLGLLIGKPFGILVGLGLGRLLGLASLPEDLSWCHALGLGMLGGIGFTISFFIAALSFGEHSSLLEVAKLSVIASSLGAGLAGYAWLRWGCAGRVT